MIVPGFWKAALVSLAAYTVAVLAGLGAGLWLTLAAIPVFQTVWTLFCGIRVVQLRREGAHKPDAPEPDRDSYAFAVGGLVSSVGLFLLIVAATQVV